VLVATVTDGGSTSWAVRSTRPGVAASVVGVPAAEPPPTPAVAFGLVGDVDDGD
jgi:hypothetical protein